MTKLKTAITGIIIFLLIITYSVAHACDIAVVAAHASSTGRPFIWKNRDNSASWKQEIQHFSAENPGPGDYLMVYNFDDLADLNNGTPVNPSGGVNASGFANACTSVYEELNPLHEALNVNTDLIRQSLQECVTVDDFDDLLQRWHYDHLGKVISGNFVVIDAHGGAALYECYTGMIGGIFNAIKYRKYDANTGRVIDYNFGITTVLDEGEGRNFLGFVNRTNANTYIPYNSGEERRYRAEDILTDLALNGSLNYRTVMTDVAKDVNGQQLSASSSEENYSTTYCISRAATRLGMVVDGVVSGGDPRLSVFWCVLGEPSIGVFVPYFVHAGEVSHLAWVDDIDLDGRYYDMSDTCLLNRASNRREMHQGILYDSNTGDALLGMDDKTINRTELRNVQQWTFPLEDFVVGKCEEYLADLTEDSDLITVENLRDFSNYCAQYVYSNYNEEPLVNYSWEFAKPWDEPWAGYARSDIGGSGADTGSIPLPDNGGGCGTPLFGHTGPAHTGGFASAALANFFGIFLVLTLAAVRRFFKVRNLS